ncbi:unnamed protein product, partial [Laminaria digitata]
FCCASQQAPARPPASQAVLSRMQLTLHARLAEQTPHGASRLVQASNVWSVKTRRAPSRHCSLVGETPTCSVALSGCEGLLSWDYGIHDTDYTPPSLSTILSAVAVAAMACCGGACILERAPAPLVAPVVVGWELSGA